MTAQASGNPETPTTAAPAAVDKSGPRVQRMFGEIAPRYDRMNHLLSLNIDRWWRRKTVRRIAPVAHSRILDVCTGTGDLAIAFQRYLRGEATIVGTDFCPEMLEIASSKAGDGEIRFSQADAQALPFEDGSFDVVTVAFGLRNVEDTDQGLREMARVCQSGGTVGVLEFSHPRRWPIRPLYGLYFRHLLPRIGRWLSPSMDAYDYLPASVGEFPCYEKLTARMEQCGLQEARFYPLTFGIATLYLASKP